MTVNNLLDLYTDNLLVSPTYCTATDLSAVTDNKVSHDKVTGLLSGKLDSSTLWKEVKPIANCSDGCLRNSSSINFLVSTIFGLPNGEKDRISCPTSPSDFFWKKYLPCKKFAGKEVNLVITYRFNINHHHI